MAKYKETIDLYDDQGKVLKSGVALEKVSPLVNPATKKLIDSVKRTVAINLGGVEKGVKTGAVGKGWIKGRELDIDIVKGRKDIIANIKDMVDVEGGETEIKEFAGGNLLLVTVPKARLEAASTYDVSITSVAAATTQAIIDKFGIGPFDAPIVKAAVWGSYPHTMDLEGGNIASVLSIPQNNEGLGFALRNIPVNHVVMITNRNAMQGAALSSTFEQAGEFEMGMAIGPFERFQLLAYAFQGLNANNLVYDTVKKNGKTGTIGTVVQSIVERALEDKVIKAGKKGGYFNFYETKDPMLWNAYCAAGTMAATMVNCGAGRFGQAVSSTLLYFNDLVEHETGLPGCDFGRVMGTAVGFSFFSHSIYGGGGPGVFNGNHVVTRHAAGTAIPCVVAAVALDAGTQMFSAEATSKIYQDTFGQMDVFAKPIQEIAKGV